MNEMQLLESSPETSPNSSPVGYQSPVCSPVKDDITVIP